MRTKSRTLCAFLAVTGFLVSGLLGWIDAASNRRSSSAAWHEVFRTPAELVRGAEIIVHAKAVGTKPGRIVYTNDGEVDLPFEVVELMVLDTLKGGVAVGESVFLERASGKSGGVEFDADGGPFQSGEASLLFLKQQPEGSYYYQINDQSRYRITGYRITGKRLKSVGDPEHDSVRQFFHGRRLFEALRFIRNNVADS